MANIIYTRPDGGVSVVSVPIASGEALAAAIARFPATASNVQIVDESAILADRTFRNAWRQAGATVAVDFAACREIARERIEQRRTEQVRGLLEREALGENVAAGKTRLRAINARAVVDAAQTIDELKAELAKV